MIDEFADLLGRIPARARTAGPEFGYRPVIDGIDSPYDFPTPTGEFTIADLGGWSDVTKKFFDPAGSIMADVETGIGVSVG